MTASLLKFLIACLAFAALIGRAESVVVYDSSQGGLYNPVGPVDASPHFIGTRFSPSASGTLETLALPLANFFPFAGPLANGRLQLWSDQAGVVGTELFSAPVGTAATQISNTVLPSFTMISAAGSPPVSFTAGHSYWVTLTQDAGSGGLTFFSNVNMAGDATVYFGASAVAQYAQGLQPMVVRISVSPVPEPAIPLMLLSGVGAIAIYRRRHDAQQRPADAAP